MSITVKVWESAMSMIKGSTRMPKGFSLANSWTFSGRELPHAGQIYSCKKLPNGNVQRRIATAYAGNKNALGIETAIFSPRGELLKAYAGIRLGASGSTSMYASGTKNDVQPVLKSMFDHQYGAKSILA